MLPELRNGHLRPRDQQQPPVPPGEGDPALHGPALRLLRGENQGTVLEERRHSTPKALGMILAHRVCSVLPLPLCPIAQ